MYTTIEPRLIARFNPDAPSPSYSNPSLDLPPLNDPNIFKSSGRPLLLEPDAIKRSGHRERNSGLDSQHHTLINGTSEDEMGTTSTGQRHGNTPPDRAFGGSSPQYLSKILDDVSEAPPRASKKRSTPENIKDDFVQLPQPVKKHKTAAQVVPPMIIGLFEPPPQAALFPPIDSSPFHEEHSRLTFDPIPFQLAEPKDSTNNGPTEEPGNNTSPVMEALPRPAVRPRKRWTEDETDNLLLGVARHGIGKWTDIIEDDDFKFNNRSKADLKDRFRTICPAEFRRVKAKKRYTAANPNPPSSLLSENILINDFSQLDGHIEGLVPLELISKPRPPKSHRRNLDDLAQLGINTPFRKSLRRARRNFSKDEDQWILEGYNTHGPAWVKIFKDPRWPFSDRQSTDLRDRFRNKYPERFRADQEKIKAAKKQSGSSSSVDSVGPQTTASTTTEGAKSVASHTTLQSQENTTKDAVENRTLTAGTQAAPARDGGLRIDEILTNSQTPLLATVSNITYSDQNGMDSDSLPFSQSFDWGNAIAAPFSSTMGEMDIARLLLDEPWPELSGSVSGKEKPSFTNISSILSSDGDGVVGGENTYYGMLGYGEREAWS